MQSITQKVWNGAQVVGKVEAGTFKKSIFASRHMLRQPPAISLSVDSLRQAEFYGAQNIEVKERESGLVYSCTMTHFKQYSFDLQRGAYEKQRALPLSFWNITGGTSTDTPAPVYHEAEAVKPEAVQMSLFAGM
jgi:hypothetical protein